MAWVVMTVCFYGPLPREWMDVLSPPLIPLSHGRRSANTWNNLDLIGGTVMLIWYFCPQTPFDALFKVRRQTIQCLNIYHCNYEKA